MVYEGVIREKPSSKEEARQFMKGLHSIAAYLSFTPLIFYFFFFNSYFVTSIADYSGRQAATVSSVLVSNLKTGSRKGEWDRVEVPQYFHSL